MGQSGPGVSPEVGRPRGAVWRTLVGEGIAWEGQVTIAGEHSDIDARMIVTGQRVVFVRNGAIALDAQRDWLDPAPMMGRNGRVSLAITTPNGNGPIPVEIRVRDGKFGATRLLSRLNDRPKSNEATFSTPPARQAGRDRSPRPRSPAPVGPARRTDEYRSGRPEARPFRPETRPTPPPVPTEPLVTSSFGIPGAALPPTATPMPSFGVAVPPVRPAERGDPRQLAPSVPENSGGVADSIPALSRDAVSRAFGERPAPAPPGDHRASGPSPTSPDNPARWTLASELLARSDPSSGSRPSIRPDGHPEAARSAPTTAQDHTDSTVAGPSGVGSPLALPAGPAPSTTTAGSTSLTLPSSSRRADPVSHARSLESSNGRSMLPGLPSETPPSDAAVDRRKVSAAPSGRVAGNSVITARSSAAARQAAKQLGSPARVPAAEVMPTAVALAGARAGVPPAPTPGPVPADDGPTLADALDAPARGGDPARRDGGGISARAWGLTAFALVALTLAAGLYLALGIPNGGGDGDQPVGLTQPTEAGSTQVAIAAATAAPTVSARPAPTATDSVPRGVGGEGLGGTIPTRSASGNGETSVVASGSDRPTAPSGDGAVPPTGTAADASTTGVAESGNDVQVAATEEPAVAAAALESSAPSSSEASSVAPSSDAPASQPAASSAEPSPEPTATTLPTAPAAEPTATAAPTDQPTATTQPTPEATATIEPTETPEATATAVPTETPEAPTATAEPTIAPTATVEPTAEPTATATAAPTPTPGPDVAPQPATVPDDGVPSQVFTVGSLRYTIESVAAGPTIPEINQPQSPFGGDWLAVVLTADNWGEGDAVIDMTQFTAYIGSNGETRQLDSYSQAVAIQLGFPKVVGAADQVAVAPGESIRLGLLFLTAQNASGFVLNAGTETIDLTAAFNSSLPMNQLGATPVPPDLLEATVTGVIDATTIEVEIDGKTVPVRYTGTAAPAIDSCFSGSSTLANRDLVMGQTVWLERQNANVDKDGTWLRDVWIESDSGSLELVSSVLIKEGVVDAAVERPNSRFAAYLETLAAIAQSNGMGIWAGCSD